MRDSASDFYWDRPDLEALYDSTCKFLDVNHRKTLTNERLTYCSDLAELLRITMRCDSIDPMSPHLWQL